MSKIINISKQNGLVNTEQITRRLFEIISTLKNGDYFIKVDKIIKHRSYSQNALMWLWFTCIEKETGTDKQDVHDYYCSLFLSRRTEINGVEKTVVGGTSKLDTVKFTDFLNKVQAEAASELGIKLPLPEDLAFAEFEDYYKRYINR